MEERKEPSEYLVVTGSDGFVIATRNNIEVARIEARFFTATLKSGRIGIDLRDRGIIKTGGLFEEITINGTVVTIDNWESLTSSLIDSGSGSVDLSDYLPRSAGSNNPVTGALYLEDGIKLQGVLDMQEDSKIAFNESIVPGLSDYVTHQVEVYENTVVNPRTGETIPLYPQVDTGNTHLPLNFSHGNNELTGKYIVYDVGSNWSDPVTYPALDKQILSTFTEGVLQIPAKFFNPVDDGAGNLVVDDVTLAELNNYAFKYELGLYPVAVDQSVLTFRVTQLSINNAVAYFNYNFLKVNGESLERYQISISGTEQTVRTLRCEKTVYQIGQLPVPFYLPYSNGNPVLIPLLDSGLNIQILYKSASQCEISLVAESVDVQILNAYRTSIYNGTPEGAILNAQTITSTPVVIDDTVYTSFNDDVTIRVMVEGAVYIANVIVGNGFAVGEIKKIHS